MTIVFIAIGAALGAPTRYLLDRTVQRWQGGRFPWGTGVVNMVACLILGAVTGAGWLGPDAAAAAGTGFCGALSTYSAFSVEGLLLARDRLRLWAVAYVVGSVLAGAGLAAAGWWLGALTG